MTGEDRMDKQVMRKQFEAWHSAHVGWELRHYDFYWNDDHYEDDEFQCAWECWQASREAVEVELPKEDGCRTSTTEDEAAQASYNRALVECKAAIEAQGLKVKQ